MTLTQPEIAKMNVTALKDALTARGLATDGKKAALAARLSEAAEAEHRGTAPAPTPAKKKKPSHTPTVFEEMLRERGVLKSTEGRGAGGQSMDAIDDHIDDLERKLGLKKGKTAKAAKQRLERELAEDGLGSSAAG